MIGKYNLFYILDIAAMIAVEFAVLSKSIKVSFQVTDAASMLLLGMILEEWRM
jgi:hypothetical protein